MSTSMEDQSKNIQAEIKIKKVLVADDDGPTRTLLRVAISQWGYEITEAIDGNAAWEILKGQNSPQLIIIDWLMPGYDGVELCQKIKRELDKDFYIILLTQQTGATNVCHALEAGANEFLTKPFNMAELRCRLAIGANFLQVKQQLANQNEALEKYNFKFYQLQSLLNEVSNHVTNSQNKNVADVKTIMEIKNNLEKILDPTK